MVQPHGVPLAEVLDVVPISPTQGAAVVWQVAVRLERWLDARAPANLVVPALEHLSIKRDGSLWWYRGRVVPSEDVVQALGALLNALLQRARHGRTPPGLLYVLARSSDARHLAHFSSLADFRAALARHATDQPGFVVDGLLARFFMQRAGCAPLDNESTISDVRRLRRAGGVSLPRIAEDTGIPISLLRELEWGVYANWDLRVARPSLEAYSVRAGLDPERVLAVVQQEQQQRSEIQAIVSHRLRTRTGGDHHASLARVTPIGLAAAMLLMIWFGSPADRGRARTPEVRLVPAAAPARPPEPRPTIVQAINREDVPEVPQVAVQRPSRRAISAKPTIKPSAESRRPWRADGARRREVSGTLGRLARAIAGDGRHKVEPFPRP